MIIFIADERVKGRRDTRGSLMFLESTKIKRATLSSHEVLWYMPDASRSLEGHLWNECRDPHAHRCQQSCDNSFNNSCSRTTGNDPHDSNAQEGSLFRALSLSGSLTKKSANLNVGTQAFLNAWLLEELSGYAYVLCPCFLQICM